MEKKIIKFIDLFAGIGGIRLGFEGSASENAQFECVFSSEWDKFAQITYNENFNEIPLGDIRKISSSEIPDFDVLCGGFPCQPFSIAGVSKKNSLNRPHGFQDHTQGTLFYEIARIIEEKKPAAFFLENVRNLENHDKGNTFQVIQSTIEGIGYSFFHMLINARSVVPQNRARVYMIGFKDKSINFEFPNIPDLNPKLRDILEDDVPSKYTLTDKLWSYLQMYAAKHKRLGNGFGFGLADLDGISRTLSARYYKDGSEILIPQEGKNPRRLTPRECARLQGYPEAFKIPVSDLQAYRQFGNSVAVPVIQILAQGLLSTLIGQKTDDNKVQFSYQNNIQQLSFVFDRYKNGRVYGSGQQYDELSITS